MLQNVPDAIFSFWYRNIKAAENFQESISFVKPQLSCLARQEKVNNNVFLGSVGFVKSKADWKIFS